MPENNLISDKALTFKLLLLLVLTSASKASEMTDLNLNYLSKSQSAYFFAHVNWFRKGKATPKPLKFSCPGEKKLCDFTTSDRYLTKLESWDTKESRVLVTKQWFQSQTQGGWKKVCQELI